MSMSDDAATLYNLTFEAESSYTKTYGKPARLYPFMDDYDGLVEPYQTSYLVASCENCPKGTKYRWTFDDDNVNADATLTGHKVEQVFTQLHSYAVYLTAYSNSLTFATYEGHVICRYVRREIRQLSDTDRELLLTTMAELWATPTLDGRVAYGDAYTSVYDLAAQHAALAGDHDCDHMHDGLGFLTQHMGLTLAFEQSLQAVDSRVSMAYWDFTIDMYEYKTAKSMASLGDSPMWKTSWFGHHTEGAEGGNNTITEGRWAYIKIEKEAWGKTHNSYGYLRAPWNNNNRAYVTRSHHMCGVEYDAMPECSDHYRVLNATQSWFDFAWALPYEPHGPVHMYIGGALDCNDTFNEVLDYIEAHAVSDEASSTEKKERTRFMYLLRTDMFLSLKNLYRDDKLSMPDYCSMDTPFSECHASCVDATHLSHALKTNDTDFIDVFWDEMFSWDAGTGIASRFKTWLDYDLKIKIIKMVCDGGIGVDGDQLEAASPMDPSFWPIHPTLERLWTYKKVSRTLLNETWPSHNYAVWDECYGHRAHDDVPFHFSLKTDSRLTYDENTTSTRERFYTNHELYSLAGPGDANMPYVYADFDWSHCAEAGYHFSHVMDEVPGTPGQIGR